MPWSLMDADSCTLIKKETNSDYKVDCEEKQLFTTCVKAFSR